MGITPILGAKMMPSASLHGNFSIAVNIATTFSPLTPCSAKIFKKIY